MGKRIVNALLCLGLVAVFVTTAGGRAEAEIICDRVDPSGPIICFEWDTGSERCRNLFKGVRGNLCEPGGTCSIVVTCSVFGTVGVNPNCSNPNVPGNVTDGCAIPGIACCRNPDEKFNVQGTAFNLPTSLTVVAEDTDCTRERNTCTNSASLDPLNPEGICNRNWTFVTFTALEFKGEVSWCPGDFDVNQDCCATPDRNPDDSCKKLYQHDGETGTPARRQAYCSLCEDPNNPGEPLPPGQCTLELSGFQCLGTSIPYTCTRIN